MSAGSVAGPGRDPFRRPSIVFASLAVVFSLMYHGREKYGVVLELFRLFSWEKIGQVTLEIRPAETEGA